MWSEKIIKLSNSDLFIFFLYPDERFFSIEWL